MSFTSVLETIGKDFAKGFKWALEYGLPVERLVQILFPSTAPVVGALMEATRLIQSAVLLVEQKFAASGKQSGSGEEKLAEVLLLTGEAVVSLLAKAGITATAEYVSRLVAAVVAILNAQPVAPVAA